MNTNSCLFIYWESFRENCPSHMVIKFPSLRLNHYNFRTVKAIDFLFSSLNTTSYAFLYGKIHFGVLHLLRASIAIFQPILMQACTTTRTFLSERGYAIQMRLSNAMRADSRLPSCENKGLQHKGLAAQHSYTEAVASRV